MSTIRGKTSHTVNGERLHYSPSEGWSGLWNVEGPKASIRALIGQLAALGYTVDYSADQNPKAQLSYSSQGSIGDPGSAEQPALMWEYFANDAQIDLLEADNSGSNGTININGLSDSERKLLRNRINGQDVDAPVGASTTFNELYKLIDAGVRSFRINVPTLRVSKLVSGSYPVKASLSNVGRIITTDTLQIQESIPSTLLFNLPASYSVTKHGFTFVYAWYKTQPNVQQAGGNRWNVSQQWEYGLWPVKLFGTAL